MMKINKLKYAIIILIMIIPTIVIAQTCESNSVRIESLEVKEKNGSTNEVTEATKNGTEINVNLNMFEVGDSITYEAVLKNDSDEDYYLDESYLIVDTDYMEYSITSSDDSNLIEANSSKTFDIKLKYRKEVEASAYESGKYTDRNNLTLNIKTESNNPYTADYIALYLGIFYLSAFVLMYLFIKKKKVEETVILLLVALLVPLSVNALCKTQITVNSIINIEKRELATFRIECAPENVTFQYYKGMTFGEWIRSDLYTDNIDGQFESLKKCENVFGKNKGCAFNYSIEKYVYHDDYYNYRYNKNDCNYPEDCEEIIDQVYEGNYYRKTYNTIEECESINGIGKCIKKDDTYVYIYKQLFESENKCNSFMNAYTFLYEECLPVHKAYRELIEHYRSFDTLDLCNSSKPSSATCNFETINYYSPTTRENDSARGRFNFRYNYMSYEIGSATSLFSYREEIDNSYPYDCTEDS